MYTRRVGGIARLTNQRVYLIVYNLPTRDAISRETLRAEVSQFKI